MLAILDAALIHRRVSPSNPELWLTPRQSWDPFWLQLLYSHDVYDASYEVLDDA
jgi:hypothetical protein